ncbi:hypothetical protein PAXINDRAFT_169924 [Paxillus involutus ATCC 200175]|uniref:Uncharacterized protein n=1 Tax=Paxillus involutus ATCC 200175 TaxID=664439 RepID=A0A0C9U4G0_PAXIN|nr:hypothetical protein PAXINDRAFT_169924 [Paxillus involutus ATCC 200175]
MLRIQEQRRTDSEEPSLVPGRLQHTLTATLEAGLAPLFINLGTAHCSLASLAGNKRAIMTIFHPDRQSFQRTLAGTLEAGILIMDTWQSLIPWYSST